MSKHLLKILFASTNPGKLIEIKQLFADVAVKVVTPGELCSEEVEVVETGDTLEKNALLKARTFAKLTKLVTLADDSGLFVEFLSGQPGVHSHRFAPGSDHDRNQHLLSLLKGVKNRQAYFRSVVCLYSPSDDKQYFFEGRVDGKICEQESGGEGFGYDPLFRPDGFDQTFGELGFEVKNRISHRAKAVQSLKLFLPKFLREIEYD